MMPIALIEDNEAHAELFQMRLDELDGLTFRLLHYRTGQEAITALDLDLPEVLFVDYRLEQENGVDVVQQIRQRGWTIPIVALTGQGDEYIAAKITRAGADDYLVKDDLSPAVLIEVFDRVLALGRERSAQASARQENADRLATLTPRELEVLDAILDGKTNKQIAAELFRSIKTIKVHRGRIMDKMQANTPAELARMVLQARATSPSAAPGPHPEP